MKIFRIFLFAIVALALMFVSTQVMAGPAPQAEPTQTGKVPGAMATQKAIEHATQGIGKPAGPHENVKGVVQAVDSESLTLKLRDGSAVVVKLAAGTQIKFPGRKEWRPTAVEVGMRVMVQALRDADGSLTARRVMVIPGKPERMHRVGKVTAYTAGASITIQDKKGESFTYEWVGDIVILPEGMASQLGAGSLVTVIAPRDPATGGVRVIGIVIHPVPGE